MDRPAFALLAAWSNFYVIVGSAAAALTGLQFVVIVLGHDVQVRSEGANRAFGTPTVVHFCAALVVAAILSAPWPSAIAAALATAAPACAGFLYALLVLRHMRRQKDYAPVLEDWIWHAVLPLVAYGAVAGASLALDAAPVPSLFAVGAGALLLLFIGIHNAWDSVTYLAMRPRHRPDEPSVPPAPAAGREPSREP